MNLGTPDQPTKITTENAVFVSKDIRNLYYALFGIDIGDGEDGEP